jgi:hypothetical protein
MTDHTLTVVVFIFIFGAATAIVFKLKGRSPALGACVAALGACVAVLFSFVGLAARQHSRTLNKNRIFISYRREDSAAVTGRIYDRLVQRFGKEAVFKDVDSIPYGVDFRTDITDGVGKCGALIAVIGDKWLSDERGHRRIDEPGDPVRNEIASALERNVLVIPLLVNNSKMPKESELPENLREMSYRNATKVRDVDPDFNPDMDRLMESLEKQLAIRRLKSSFGQKF